MFRFPEPALTTARKGRVQLIDGSGFWRKMSKSLGSKRKELGEGDIATLTRLFGEFTEAELARIIDAEGREIGREVVLAGEAPLAAPEGGRVRLAPLSRILPNESFGYRQITVERPLRVAYSYSDWFRVEKLRSVARLDLEDQNRLEDVLHAHLEGARFLSRSHFVEVLRLALSASGNGHIDSAGVLADIADACAVPDPKGEIVTDKRRNLKPDPALRDTKTVPLSQDIPEYFAREVLPHAPDA